MRADSCSALRPRGYRLVGMTMDAIAASENLAQDARLGAPAAGRHGEPEARREVFQRQPLLLTSGEVRAELGLARFASAANTPGMR